MPRSLNPLSASPVPLQDAHRVLFAFDHVGHFLGFMITAVRIFFGDHIGLFYCLRLHVNFIQNLGRHWSTFWSAFPRDLNAHPAQIQC